MRREFCYNGVLDILGIIERRKRGRENYFLLTSIYVLLYKKPLLSNILVLTSL